MWPRSNFFLLVFILFHTMMSLHDAGGGKNITFHVMFLARRFGRVFYYLPHKVNFVNTFKVPRSIRY